MWYTLPNNTKHYPLTIQRVKEIKRLNQQGVVVDELQAVELTNSKVKEVENSFVELVGQISLKSLEKNDRRRRDQQRNDRPNNNGPRNNGPNNGPRPNNNGPRNAGPNNGPRPNNNSPRPNNGPRPNNNGPRPNDNRPPQNNNNNA